MKFEHEAEHRFSGLPKNGALLYSDLYHHAEFAPVKVYPFFIIFRQRLGRNIHLVLNPDNNDGRKAGGKKLCNIALFRTADIFRRGNHCGIYGAHSGSKGGTEFFSAQCVKGVGEKIPSVIDEHEQMLAHNKGSGFAACKHCAQRLCGGHKVIFHNANEHIVKVGKV